MNNTIKISDLDGILTITKIGGDSLLSVGELAQESVFEALSKISIVGLGKPTSQKQYDKAARNSYYVGKEQYDRKQNANLRCKMEKTLLKNVKPNMFGDVSLKTIKEVTGKVPIRTKKATIPPQLTVEELVACSVAEWAYSSFGTLKGVSFLLSLTNNKIFKKF